MSEPPHREPFPEEQPQSAKSRQDFASDLTDFLAKEFGWDESKRREIFAKDDWTFVVKLHAMIESGLNGAIALELDRPQLLDIIAKLGTSNSAGKAEFAKTLGIIHPESAKFIQQLSTLRNECVHDIRNFESFSLLKYLNGLEKGARNTIVKPIEKLLKPVITTGTDTVPREEVMKSHPRLGIVIGTMTIMSELMLNDRKCENRRLQRRIEETEAAKYRELLASQSKQ